MEPRLDAEDLEFAVNQEPRCPCVLVLDVSGSMSGAPIEALNGGLRVLEEALAGDAIARSRVEIAIVTFGPVSVEQQFAVADQFSAPTLHIQGATPMGEAVVTALDLIEDRKRIYKENGISYYRPWLWLMTDGAPTDSIEAAVARAEHAENAGQAVIFAVGVGSAVGNAALARLSPKRPPLALQGLSFNEMFLWLSRSQGQRSRSANTSNRPASDHQQVPLPSIDGWASTY